MFWKFNLLTSSHIDTLLDKEDVTLRELMDEDDILQECKAQNRKLVDFIVQSENMKELMKMITVEPPDDVDEKLRFKYPNTACELLTSDVAQINDRLAGDAELINMLYGFLEGDKPLNPLLASFFSKVMGLLITRKSEMIFEYLKSKNDFVERLLYHIGTSAVMDLLLRLITCIESPDTRKNVTEWLSAEKIVEKLVDSIVASKDEDIHCNAAQSLCDIVRLGREQFIHQPDLSDTDPLLRIMEQEETVAQLLSRMFDSDKNESVLVNGLCVIHTLLEVQRQATDPCEQLPNGETDHYSEGISNVIAAIIPRLKDFHDLLLNPPKQRYYRMPTTVCCLEPPLGNTRLQVAKLITTLVGVNMHQVNTELASLGTVQTLLDLFFKYEWNNFLHTQVEQCLLIILNNRPVEIDSTKLHPLLSQIFAEYSFVQRLLVEWELNQQRQKIEHSRRSGFMGHLTKIANTVAGLVEKNDTGSFVKDLFNGLSQDVKDRWEAFVAGSLAEVNKKNAIELMRGRTLASSSEDDDTDFKDIPFPQDSAMQQAFSDYQLQQMTSNFIDQFGFSDEDFAEQDEKIETVFSNRISNINADIQAHGINQSTTLFEQVCSERIQQFDDNDSDEDIWEEKAITFDKAAGQAHLERLRAAASRCNNSDEDSTDSGEELDSPVRTVQPPTEGMDVDHNEDSSAQTEPAAMDTTSPWDKPLAASPATAPPKESWADFNSVANKPANGDNWADFSSFTDFPSLATQGPRSSSPVEMDTTEDVRKNPYVVPAEDSQQEKDESAITCAVTQTESESSSPEVNSTSLSQPSARESDTVSSNLSFVESQTPGGLAATTQSQVTSTISELTNIAAVGASNLGPLDTAASAGSLETTAAVEPKVAQSLASNVSLPDNQSFLATSGLMKNSNPVAATCPISQPSAESPDSGAAALPASPPVAAVPPALMPTTPSIDDQAMQEPLPGQFPSKVEEKIEHVRAPSIGRSRAM
ncbi:unnamed protein product [Candidula unifasciata]|uniref:Serine/threonine-protein phosphatase 6 regulatory subunit 3 n=1 Tax=Candidula unifasciata TaxID=100452 RepID=A0A8S3YVS0_9EUPU|nr:unnamed protein product [Candidula unifasciata]